MLILVWEPAQGSRTITGEPLALPTRKGRQPWTGLKQPRLAAVQYSAAARGRFSETADDNRFITGEDYVDQA